MRMQMRFGRSFALTAAAAAGLALGAILGAAVPVAAQERPTSKYVYPLAPPISKEPKVTVDISDDPKAAEWAKQAQKLVSEWFPIAWRLLATDGLTPPAEVRLVFRQKINAPAYASGNTITVNGEWISRHPDDFGMMVHELVHLIQRYPSGGNKPGWLVEGIADYIRWWRYEPEAPRTPINPARASYRDSYRTTAWFLAWLTARYDRSIVPRLDRALRERRYEDALFKEITGKDLDTLWAEFLPKPPANDGAAAAAKPGDR